MKLALVWGSACASALVGVVAGSPAPPSSKPSSSATAGGEAFVSNIHSFFTAYCDSCHGGKSPSAGLALDRISTEAEFSDPKVMERVLSKLRARTMPPPGQPRPKDADYEKLIGMLDAHLSAGGCKDASPGRVTMRRLNKAEYKNTIRDLVGVDFKAASDFPSDDVGYGFDNIGDVLSLPPMLMEKYMDAAEQIIAQGYSNIAVGKPAKAEFHDGWARKIVSRFATRAFRRPVTPTELNRLLVLVQAGKKSGKSIDAGVKLACEAVLVSPHFLFRIESDPPVKGNAPERPISNFQLASRLSYFLWSSMPDDELLQSAAKGTLRQPEVLEHQIRRMLKDTKSQALTDNFGGQWLETRRLKKIAPDPELFPNFNENLRKAMLTETELFFNAVVHEDRSVLDFVDGKYTFLNEPLAKLYGIPGVKGPEFRRVALKGDERAGVLTQASILTLTSNPTRTSPVKRGKFILEEFLNEAPPPPPASVPPLKEDHGVTSSASLRERMEQHRKDPACASCHAVMDPIGFALENFNAVGKWRTQDGKFKINAACALPSGQTLNGPAGMRKLLLSKKKEYLRCLTQKMLTYALGRGLERADDCVVDQIAQQLPKDSYKFSSLVRGVVQSAPFQRRAIEVAEGAKS